MVLISLILLLCLEAGRMGCVSGQYFTYFIIILEVVGLAEMEPRLGGLDNPKPSQQLPTNGNKWQSSQLSGTRHGETLAQSSAPLPKLRIVWQSCCMMFVLEGN